MTSGKCIALALHRVDAISMWRGLIGPTNSETAKEKQPRSLRGLFGTDGTCNACHGSDSVENGAREIGILLPDYFKHQSTLAILKPDLNGPARHAVLKRIRDEGFFVQDEKRVTLSADEARSFYAQPGAAQGADPKQAAAMLASGPCIAMVLSRPNAIRHWTNVLGPNDAKAARETAPLTVRGSFAKGSDAIRNACHGSDSVVASARELAFFFPRMARAAKPPPGQTPATQYVENELQPVLTKALTQLCKEKPPDPLRWLSSWILENNPNKPRIELPPKPEKRQRGAASKAASKVAATGQEVVFLMGPNDQTTREQAKLTSAEFGFAHISVKDLIEEEMRGKERPGSQEEMQSADMALGVIRKAMALSVATKFVVTEFPQNMDHVRAYEKVQGSPPKVLCFEPTGGLAAMREEADSAEERRLDAYEENTGPCLMYYSKKKMLTKIPHSPADEPGTIFRQSLRRMFFKSKAKHLVFLLGPDAVGRATVAAAISDKYEFRNINLGSLMTDEIIAKTPLGNQISGLLKAKRTIPKDIVIGLLKDAILKDSEINFVIDGFPLSIDEMAGLEKAVGVSCDMAVFLKCNEEIVQARLAADKAENAATARAIEDARGSGGLAAGVVKYLEEEGKLTEIDANQRGEDVLADIEGQVLIGNFKIRSKKVFVLGGPGSGKGTQCKLLVEKYGFVHLSAGDLLRAEVRSGSANGTMISEMIRQGKIVPAQVTVDLLKAAMDKSMSDRFLIDGFPRDHANVLAWEKSLGNPEFVLFIDCDEEEMERRLIKRGQTSGRTDDNAATIKKRFKTFVEQSMPVIDVYDSKKLVRKVSAAGSVTQVHDRVVRHFKDFREVPDIVFVLGGPGSGKGTQCIRIANEYGFVHLSAGDLLRAEIQCGSKDGGLIAGMIREGKIVPQEITIRLLRQAMDAKPGCRFLIDGFPRALAQAAAFEEMVGHPKMVLYFDAPDDVLVGRLLARGRTSGRTDDNEESIKKRLATNHSQAAPVVTAYEARGLVRRISAVPPPDDVFVEVEKALGSFRKCQIMYVLGQPLAGKTTLCKSLARTGEFEHIATSDLLKRQVAMGTDVGAQIADCVKSGKKVPAEVIVGLIKEAVAESEKGKLLVDGFPRTAEEATMLATAVGQPTKALYLDCALTVGEQTLTGSDVMMHRNSTIYAEGGGQVGMDLAKAEIKLKERYESFEQGIEGLLAAVESRGILHKIAAAQAVMDEEGVVQKETVTTAEGDQEKICQQHTIPGSKATFEQASAALGI